MQQDISIADVVKIVNLDPVIASKLIQVANSPLYRTVKPIAKLHDAINRLGLKATQNLVTSISLHNLFRSKSRLLNNRIQQLWRQSIQVASLSYTLAA
jgi:HD-like signal output (HDOD) protein